MTEEITPTVLHQDPRYFRRGKGRALARLGYSMGQISGRIGLQDPEAWFNGVHPDDVETLTSVRRRQ